MWVELLPRLTAPRSFIGLSLYPKWSRYDYLIAYYRPLSEL